MRLAGVAQGRDNNFNLLRICSAFAVLVTHGFALTKGSADVEPLRVSLGVTFGTIAVDVFFVSSGFLVTGSLLERQSLSKFCWARILRIYPALLLVVLLSVFVLGLLLTSWPSGEYLTNRETLVYLIRNATLIFGVSFKLPGVFETNPWPNAVNGSLWTLPYEVRMYLTLAFLWLISRLKVLQRTCAFELLVVLAAGVSLTALIGGYYALSMNSEFVRLSFMFFLGSSCYTLRKRIILSRSVVFILFVAVIGSSFDRNLFFLTYTLSIGYLVFGLAYLPSGFIRRYNRVGDYSYGVYIYAFPIQQIFAALVPSISLLEMIVFSSGCTLLLAVVSWHFVESPMLRLKNR